MNGLRHWRGEAASHGLHETILETTTCYSVDWRGRNEKQLGPEV